MYDIMTQELLKAAGGLPHLPSLLDMLFHDQLKAISQSTGLKIKNIQGIVMAWLAAIFLIVFCWYLTRKIKEIPGPKQNLAEAIVLFFRNFFGDLLGEYTDQYLPFLGAMFLYILFMNLFPLVPGLATATELLSTTLGIALATFFATHVEGVRKQGWDYLLHFLGPRDPWWLPFILGWFMVPVKIMEEFIRPLSLSLRLFGNMLGKDILVAVMLLLLTMLGSFAWAAPLQFPLYFIKIIAAVIQAIIFTVLSAAYIGGAVGAGEGH